MALQQIKKVIVRDAIIENIMRYIRENGVKTGERIPSERTLAAEMRVSRSSVREALKSLESGGILEIRHGGGAFFRSSTSLAVAGYSSDQREQFVFLKYLVQARRMVEERAVVDVIPLLKQNDIGSLYDMEKEQLDMAEHGQIEEGSRFELPNMNFELAITSMLRNPVILDMHRKIERLWKKTFRSLSTTPFPARERYSHHVEIIRAMEGGNVKAAVKAMAYHNTILEDYIDEEIRKLDARDNMACG
jgi:GntR family transcriptional repressor for pyruvate dehydrogenase complex